MTTQTILKRLEYVFGGRVVTYTDPNYHCLALIYGILNGSPYIVYVMGHMKRPVEITIGETTQCKDEIRKILKPWKHLIIQD